MTDLEILAGLKVAYLRLEDIAENQDEQITKNEYEYIMLPMSMLSTLYEKVYKRIEKENKEILYYEKNVVVADRICSDYLTESEDYDNQYICYDDINTKTKWWEDYKFLWK